MPYSSGTFSRVHDFTSDRDAGIKIQASRTDAEFDGIATALSTAILKDGTQTTTAVVPFAFGISIVDNKAITLGTNSDITIQYDETTNDSLEIAAAVEGAALGIVLKSDQGDDNADQHKLSIADGGTLTLASKISGSFVTYLTHTPNSTVASSTLAVAGNLTVGGNLTLGSGAELSEAELEMLDGITAGTVAASKAVVVDSNKDIASFRNITLTGELDAGSLDVSGDIDVDGTSNLDVVDIDGAVDMASTLTVAGVVDITDTTDSSDATGDTGALRVEGGVSIAKKLFVGTDADIDGTLEADVMTLNGATITTTATLSTGISNGNVLVATSGIADNDFLRVDGTSIEGRSASEVLSDISASPVAGSSSIVTTGALDSGSITSGFGNIDTGSSTITTTGAISGGTLTGTLQTAAQANITSVGTITNLRTSDIVGIGNSSPTSPNDATAFLHIGDGNEQDVSIVLQDGVEIWEIYQNDDLNFRTDTTNIVTMARTSGDVTISTGNLIIGTSGKGIDFSAETGDGPSVTSELLDSYEEGNIGAIGISVSGSNVVDSTNSNKYYVKVGRVVHLYFHIVLNGTLPAGTHNLTGMPFTSSNSGPAHRGAGVANAQDASSGFGEDGNYIPVRTSENSTSIIIHVPIQYVSEDRINLYASYVTAS